MLGINLKIYLLFNIRIPFIKIVTYEHLLSLLMKNIKIFNFKKIRLKYNQLELNILKIKLLNM